MASKKQAEKVKFTKALIEGLPLPEEGQVLLWDNELRGFGIRLTRTTKTYILQARVNNKERKNRRVSIGRHDLMTLSDARKRARAILADMIKGIDPSPEKNKAMTLRDFTDRYMLDRDLKENSIRDIEKHMKTSFADWVNKPVTEITRNMVDRRFDKLSQKSHAQANLAFRLLRGILNYASAERTVNDEPLLAENPVKVLSEKKKWHRIEPRSGRVPLDKIGLAWALIEKERHAPQQTAVSRTLADMAGFLLLTGARWTEAAALTWDRVDLSESWWHLPDPKNRHPVTFPLPSQIVEILMDRPRTSQFVFPGFDGTKYVNDGRAIMKKISEAAGVKLSAHDLRRTFRAVAGECGIEFFKCKLLLNHRLAGDVTIHSYTETSDLRYLSKEIQRVADWIASQGRAEKTGNVLPFRRAE